MCEYCNDGKQFGSSCGSEVSINIHDGVLWAWFVGRVWKIFKKASARGVPINYCPMCGRKLKEDSDD